MPFNCENSSSSSSSRVVHHYWVACSSVSSCYGAVNNIVSLHKAQRLQFCCISNNERHTDRYCFRIISLNSKFKVYTLSSTMSHLCFETCTGCGSLNASNLVWPFKYTVADITRHLCTSPTTCTGLMSWKHSSDCDLVPVRLLIVPRTRLCTIGDQAFGVAAARVWNSLPPVVTSASSLPSFKRQLKTFLFQNSFHFLSFSFILIVYRVLEAFCHVNSSRVIIIRHNVLRRIMCRPMWRCESSVHLWAVHDS